MAALGWLIFAVALALAALAVWNAVAWPRVRMAHGGVAPGAIAILIPARNEAERIAPCIESALAQGGVVAEVLVYDDHSDDGTAEVVLAAAGGDPRVRVLAPRPLPEGWAGKPFGCLQLAQAAQAPWFLFLDADARLASGGAEAILAEAQSRNVTLLAPWPGLDQHGFWESLLMPLLNFCVLTLFPAPLSLKRPDPSLALAHGACILAEAEAYWRVGGHEAVRNAFFEDTLLARHWRAQGEATACLDGADAVRVRMYDSFSGIWRGFAKIVHSAFARETSFWLFIGLHAAVFLAPFIAAPALLLSGAPAWGWLGAALCVLGARAALALRFRQAGWSVLLHPVAEGILLANAITGWTQWLTGRGHEWKGRRQLPGAAAGGKE